MQTFLYTVALVILVGGLIRLLHTLQQRSARLTAEQAAPLPPLDDVDQPGLVTVAPEVTAAQALPWQDEVKALRDNGRFQEAIRLCRRQYPRMLAYRQTLITLRASMKQEPAVASDTLDTIYRTAILGELARLQKSDFPQPDLAEMNTRLEHPRDVWQQLGYKNLELLTRQDCRLLADHWGEPRVHTDIYQLLLQR